MKEDSVLPLLQSTDAREWAREFNKVLVSKGEQPWDEGFLIGWFANAIMTGYDAGKKRTKDRIGKYELSGDKKGLLKYFKDNSFYHIHSDELTKRERKIHKKLLKSEKKSKRKWNDKCLNFKLSPIR